MGVLLFIPAGHKEMGPFASPGISQGHACIHRDRILLIPSWKLALCLSNRATFKSKEQYTPGRVTMDLMTWTERKAESEMNT